MRAKADYMHSFGVSTVSDVARTLAMFGAFTEGMSLFAGFAMLLNFPRHNKMNGMGQIVTGRFAMKASIAKASSVYFTNGITRPVP